MRIRTRPSPAIGALAFDALPVPGIVLENPHVPLESDAPKLTS